MQISWYFAKVELRQYARQEPTKEPMDGQRDWQVSQTISINMQRDAEMESEIWHFPTPRDSDTRGLRAPLPSLTSQCSLFLLT